MTKNHKDTKKSSDQLTQEIFLELQELIDKTDIDNKEHLKNLIIQLEMVFSHKIIAKLLNLSEKKVKKLGNSERAKLDAVLKRLFETSPRMFLGTIDYLYKTDYRKQYLAGTLTDADISFEPTELIRGTFETLKTDILIQIKNIYYHIEIQTSNDNMAIRLARYGLEIALKRHAINPKTGALRLDLPTPSVIYLEHNRNNPKSNNYEVWWENKKYLTMKVADLKLWELDIADILERELYTLLPVIIFNYRIKLKRARSKAAKLELKDEILEKAKQILEQAHALSNELVDGDIDTIIAALGELINYFDDKFFNGAIEKTGEFNMTFTEEIKGYRTKINTAEKKGKAEGLAEGLEKGIKQGKAEGEAKGLEKGILKVAKSLLEDGFEIDRIMKNTGLSEERLKQLQAKIKKS